VTERFDWRKYLAVHPAANLLPLMSEAEIKELAEDIKANGLRAPIVIWKEAIEGECSRSLLDGRNRLDALALLGLLEVRNGRGRGSGTSLEIKNRSSGFGQNYFSHGNPYAIALSLNVHRRHLTPEQRRDLIAKVLKATPEKSNNQIAKEVKVDDKTIAKVRAALESRSEIPNVDARTDTKGRKQPAKHKQPSEEVHERSKRRAEKKGAAIRATLDGSEPKPKPEPEPRVTESPEISIEQRRAQNAELDTEETAAERSAFARQNFATACRTWLPLMTDFDRQEARQLVIEMTTPKAGAA
jgi:ParB-like nuclease domain